MRIFSRLLGDFRSIIFTSYESLNSSLSFDRKTVLIEQISSKLRRFLSNRANSSFCCTSKNHQRLVTMDFRAVSSLFLRLGSFTVDFWSFEAVEDNSASQNLFGNLTSGHLIHRNRKITRNKMVIYVIKYMFRTSFYLKAASARKEDSIDTVHLSNDSPDDKLLNGASFIAIVILGVLENIFEICPFKRTNLNSVGLGGLIIVISFLTQSSSS